MSTKENHSNLTQFNIRNNLPSPYIYNRKIIAISKITKILNSEENSKRKVPNKWQNQKLKHIKQMDNNRLIPDFVHAFSYVESDTVQYKK